MRSLGPKQLLKATQAMCGQPCWALRRGSWLLFLDQTITISTSLLKCYPTVAGGSWCSLRFLGEVQYLSLHLSTFFPFPLFSLSPTPLAKPMGEIRTEVKRGGGSCRHGYPRIERLRAEGTIVYFDKCSVVALGWHWRNDAATQFSVRQVPERRKWHVRGTKRWSVCVCGAFCIGHAVLFVFHTQANEPQAYKSSVILQWSGQGLGDHRAHCKSPAVCTLESRGLIWMFRHWIIYLACLLIEFSGEGHTHSHSSVFVDFPEIMLSHKTAAECGMFSLGLIIAAILRRFHAAFCISLLLLSCRLVYSIRF